jgi:hypothetical protein
MDDRQQYDDHHAEYMAGEHESETERDMLDKEPDGTSEDELKNDLQLSVRLALENGMSVIDIDMWVQDAVKKYYDFIKDKQALVVHND